MVINGQITRHVLRLIFIIILMDIVGLTIIFPVAPYIIQRYSSEALMVTLLTVIYAGGQFFAAPALGKISDRVGRRTVLLICVLGSAIGYFIFGIGGVLWVLFLARLIDGTTGGNISTASAYIVDVSKPEERAKNFTLLGMAYGLLRGLLMKRKYSIILWGCLAVMLIGLAGCQGQRNSTAETRPQSTWEKVVPGGDCECADGSEFAFWERQADPSKVVFFLDGGGACFDAITCAFTGDYQPADSASYDWNIRDDDPASEGGIFDFARADNPFLNYSFIYVPSCTGDAHLGDVTRQYSPELTVEHNGFVNGTAALSYLAEHYPDADQVVVVGKTVGAVAAPIYGGLVADLLPDAHVTVFGAQSGNIPDDPDLNAEILGELWGAYDNMPDWEVNDGLTARDWGPPRFWIQAGLHDPDIVLARFDYAYDQQAAEGAELTGQDPSNLLAVIDANEASIEAAGVVLHSYTAPGHDHGILEWPKFYELEVNDVRLVDWVEALIAGEPLDDVHCDACRTE